MQLYRYVGPDAIRQGAECAPAGMRVASASDLVAWIEQTRQSRDAGGLIVATFVVDRYGFLRAADRRSEHVICAGSDDVWSAGEMFFARTPSGLRVVEVSNQSTGYCPEPSSWPWVAAALDQVPLEHPDHFTFACTFRRCPACGQVNLIKDDLFECGVCGAPLPAHWNVDRQSK